MDKALAKLAADQNTLYYQIAMTLLPGVGDITAKILISYCGSEEAVFKTPRARLQKIPNVGVVTANAVHKFDDFDRVEEELKFIEENDIQTISYRDKAYPYRLKNCADSPILLYYKGNADLNAPKIIGIVGTRNATAYGKDFCDQLVEGLKPHNPLIVSGLAYGIDIQAHKAAVANEIPTVGVMAHGLDNIYPAQNKAVAKKMVENGGLLTDYPTNTRPNRENFPMRNRIVAGLCDALVVVESKIKGGSMITAEIANSYSRDVFAVPGNIDNPNSEGCNYLIRKNKAALLDSASALEEFMCWDAKVEEPPRQQHLMLDLTDDEQKLVDLLQEKGSASLDDIRLNISINYSAIAASLLSLELKGIVRSMPGNIVKMN